MYNYLLRLDRQPFNFEDSLRVRGDLLESVYGARQIGCFLTEKDTNATPVQVWLLSLAQTLTELRESGYNYTSPDQPLTDSDNSNANTKFVQDLLAQKITEVLGNAPIALNTLKKLAVAINNDPAFFTTLQTALDSKIGLLDIQKDTISTTTIVDNASAWTTALKQSVSSLTDGMVIRARSPGVATTQPTLVISNVTGDTPHAISLLDGTLLRAGDIPSSGYWMFLQWSAGASKWLLLNPALSARAKYATNQQAVDGLLTNVAVTPQGVSAIVNAVLGASTGAMGTIEKLAQAIGQDGNLFTTLTQSLALKANIDSPVFTGSPKVPTPALTDNSNAPANTEFVQNVVAEQASAGATPMASLTVVGKLLLADIVKTVAGTDTASAITPQLLKSVTDNYLLKSNAAFTGYPRVPTQPPLTNDSTVANTEFDTRLYNAAMVGATETTFGMVRYATDVQAATPTLTNVAITPKTLKVIFDSIPSPSDATTAVKGIARHSTTTEAVDGISSNTELTPASFKAAIDARLAASSGSFASPAISSGASAYVGSPFTFTISASPISPATAILTFDILVKSRDSTEWQIVANALPASANQLTYNFTPTVTHVGVSQIQVKAKDDRGNISPLGSKDFTVVQITVNPPVITFPTNNQTEVSHTPTFIVEGFGLSQGVGSHMATNWKLDLIDTTGDVLTWSSPSNTSNKTQISLIDNILAAGYQYRLSVQFVDQTYGESAWSTAVFTPTPAGANTLMQTIASPAPVQNGWFGFPAVSKDGAWMAIGAMVEKCVRIYKWNEVSSAYEYVTLFQIDEPDPGNYTYGSRVSMNYAGDRLLVSCPRVATITTVSTSIGYVFEYERVGQVWSFTRKFSTQTDTTSGAGSVTYAENICMSRDGMHLVAQASKGCVHFLAKQTNGSWLKVSESSHSGFLTDFFGSFVSFDATATRVAISAQGDKLNGSVGGRVYVYVRQPNGTWVEEAGMHPTTMNTNQLFSKGLCLNAAGDILIVGSPQRTNNGLASCGSLCVFKRTGTTWAQLSERFQDTPSSNAGLGNCLSWSDNEKRLIVSALYSAQRTIDFGRVYYASWDPATNVITFDSSVNEPTATQTYYSNTVVIVPNGRRVLISHPWGTNTVASEGLVYVRNC